MLGANNNGLGAVVIGDNPSVTHPHLWENLGYDVNGNVDEVPSYSYGNRSDSRDVGHWFKTTIDPGFQKKLATVHVYLEDNYPVEWAESLNHEGFIDANNYSPPFNVPINSSVSANGFFGIKGVTSSDGARLVPHDENTLQNKFAEELHNVHDIVEVTYTDGNGSTQTYIKEFKFDLMFTESQAGTTLPQNVNRFRVDYKGMGRNYDDQQSWAFDVGASPNGFIGEDTVSNQVTPFTNNFHPMTNPGSYVSDSILLAHEQRAYNIPARRFEYSIGKVRQFPWIHPDYTAILNVKFFSGFSIKTEQVNNQSWEREIRADYFINNFTTGLSSSGVSNSEYIIPSEGVKEGSRVKACVSGSEGAKFSANIVQTKWISVDALGAPISTNKVHGLLTDQDYDGGKIRSLSLGLKKISKDNYKFNFPYVASLDVEAKADAGWDGWKEFIFEIKADQDTSINAKLARNKNTDLVIVPETQDLTAGGIIRKKLFQFPNVNVKLEVGGLPSGVSQYKPGYNITDVKSAGMIRNTKGAKPLTVTGRLKKGVSFYEYEITFDIRITRSSSTFSLIKNHLTAIEDPDGTVDHYVVNTSAFAPSIPTSNTRLTDEIEPGKNNMDIVDFYAVAHIGDGLGNTSVDYATLSGVYRVKRFGLRPQTYTIDLSTIFNNS